MAKIIINKNYFKTLSNGTHNLKVNFKDGYAQGTFEVKNAISFTIEDLPCTATEGMSWYDWFYSSDTVSGNTYVTADPDSHKLYINHKNGRFDHISGIAALDKNIPPYATPELTLHEEGSSTQQSIFDQIKNGAKYGRLNTGGADAPE
jgi:hypothetical protein